MPFRFQPSPFSGAFLIEVEVFQDLRGSFSETYRRSDFADAGIHEVFVQANRSRSVRGSLRGLHYQRGSSAQGKLVRVVRGTIYDACVDLRPGSATFGQAWGTELTDDGTQLYLPPGLAHGFLTLSEDSDFEYLCTAEYDPSQERGIRWDDPDLSVPWPLAGGLVPMVSLRDQGLPWFRDIFPRFWERP
jgi:dTDP-4-dehydrorhamnose 3,5-epimerase